MFWVRQNTGGRGAQRRSRQTELPLHVLHAQQCDVCPLARAALLNPRMGPEGPDDAPLYVLGEAPGEQEDKLGRPFVGASGQLLRSELAVPARIWNVLRCRPPANRTPEQVEIECCRPYIAADIAKVRPVVLLAVGAVALRWISGEANISLWHGRYWPVTLRGHRCWCWAVLHPAYILRAANKLLEQEWRLVMRRVCRFVTDPPRLPDEIQV